MNSNPFRKAKMNRAKRSPAIAWLICVSLLVGLCSGATLTGRAQTESAPTPVEQSQAQQNDQSAEEPAFQGPKISPDLMTPTDDSAGGRGFSTQASASDLVRVIVQLNQPASVRLNGFLNSHAVEKGRFVKLNSIVVEIAQSNIQALASFPEVRYISVDRNVEMHGHVETASGAWDMRQQAGNTGLDGSGVGIAVLD